LREIGTPPPVWRWHQHQHPVLNQRYHRPARHRRPCRCGGRYTVQGGFWDLIAAIQTPGAPPLQIINTGTNAVAIVWPTTQTLFSLHENTDLNTTNWVSVGVTPTDDGTNTNVFLTPAAGNRLFRLKWP